MTQIISHLDQVVAKLKELPAPVTIDKAIPKGASHLEQEVPEYGKHAQEATNLLAHVLEINYDQVMASQDRILEQSELLRFAECIARRAQHEPIAYIRGYRYFMTRKFLVNEHVMVPTAITMQLVERALEHRARAAGTFLFADVGTGSGAIATTLALESGEAVMAMDLSEDALSLATQNAKLLNAQKLVQFRQGNLIEPLLKESSLGSYDALILCANLPYQPEEEWNMLESELRDFEPELARRGGVDGLSLYRQLFDMVLENVNHLPKTVVITLEVDPRLSENLMEMINVRFPKANLKCELGRFGIVDIIDVELIRE